MLWAINRRSCVMHWSLGFFGCHSSGWRHNFNIYHSRFWSVIGYWFLLLEYNKTRLRLSFTLRLYFPCTWLLRWCDIAFSFLFCLKFSIIWFQFTQFFFMSCYFFSSAYLSLQCFCFWLGSGTDWVLVITALKVIG